MNKAILTLAAASIAALGLVSAASAEGRDAGEQAGYEQAIKSVTEAKVNPAPAVVYEGRNAATEATQGVEPYIAQSVEQDSRSR